jgi:hypothetical protein
MSHFSAPKSSTCSKSTQNLLLLFPYIKAEPVPSYVDVNFQRFAKNILLQLPPERYASQEKIHDFTVFIPYGKGGD